MPVKEKGVKRYSPCLYEPTNMISLSLPASQQLCNACHMASCTTHAFWKG